MKANALILPAAWLAIFLLGGCAAVDKSHPSNSRPPASEKLGVRNNAASLLYDLMSQEKNVSKILIIKFNSDELGRLIKAVSVAAADAEKQMARMATNDPGLDLHVMQLPPGEQAGRDAVAKTKEHELLFTSGKEFEFNLLLTQAEALSYGWHLAKVAADNSSEPGQVQTFTAMSRRLEDLCDQVIAQMRR